MNILFFLTPKCEVTYLKENDTIEQGLMKLDASGYTAVPLIDKQGRYVGTVTEGDFLRLMTLKLVDISYCVSSMKMKTLARRNEICAVNVSCSMEAAMKMSMKQNFVPVVDDDGIFIGIITRKDILEYMYQFVPKKQVENAIPMCYNVSECSGQNKKNTVRNKNESEVTYAV